MNYKKPSIALTSLLDLLFIVIFALQMNIQYQSDKRIENEVKNRLSQVMDYKQQIKNLTDEIQTKRKDLTDTDNQLKTTGDRIESLNKYLQKKSDEIQRKESEAEIKKKSQEEYWAKLSEKIRRSESVLREIEQKKLATEQEIAKEESRLNELRKQQETDKKYYESKIEKLTQDLVENKELQQKYLAELKSYKSQIDDLMQDLKESKELQQKYLTELNLKEQAKRQQEQERTSGDWDFYLSVYRLIDHNGETVRVNEHTQYVVNLSQNGRYISGELVGAVRRKNDPVYSSGYNCGQAKVTGTVQPNGDIKLVFRFTGNCCPDSEEKFEGKIRSDGKIEGNLKWVRLGGCIGYWATVIGKRR